MRKIGTGHPTIGMLLLLGAMTAFAAISIDLYLPALPDIARSFETSPDAATRTISAFLIGMALAQIGYGPLTDKIGRRGPLLVGITIYVAASVVCAVATSIEMLTIGRFVQAMGACAGMVVSRAVVRDLYDHRESARIFSMLMLVLGLAPILAPLVGSGLLLFASWRWIFVVLALFGLTVGVLAYRSLAESRSEATAATARGESALGAYGAALSQPRLLGYVLTGALNGACLMTYLANAPAVIMNGYGLTPQVFALVFASNGIGFILGSQLNHMALRRMLPDDVLALSTPIVVLLSLLMILSALTGIGGMWGVLAPLFFVLATFGFTGANTSAGALSVDPTRSGTVSSLLGASSFGAGAAASAIASFFYDGTALPMAIVMGLSTAAAMLSYFLLARPRSPA